jgi:hypothetical protein
MALRQMLNMAEWHLDRVRAGWDAARERAIARGVHLGSKAPTGHRRRPDGRLTVDRVGGPAITELFARRAEGTPISALAALLERRGVRTPYGNRHWAYTSTRGLLQNRVYLGEVRSGEFVKANTHPPLTDPATWQLAQAPVEIREPRAALPAGVANVRCAGCRMTMNTHTTYANDGRAIRHYVCRRRYAAGPCRRPPPSPARCSSPTSKTSSSSCSTTGQAPHDPPSTRPSTQPPRRKPRSWPTATTTARSPRSDPSASPPASKNATTNSPAPYAPSPAHDSARTHLSCRHAASSRTAGHT